MDNNEIIDMIYNSLSKNDSKNLSCVNKRFHLIYNRRISNLYSVTHQLKNVFSENLYNELIEVMKRCKSFLSGSFISNIINLNKSKPNIDIYCQCESSPDKCFDDYGAMMMSGRCGRNVTDGFIQVYEKIIHDNVDKNNIEEYFSDNLLRYMKFFGNHCSWQTDNGYSKQKISEILCRYLTLEVYHLFIRRLVIANRVSVIILSTCNIEEKCLLYKLLANNSNVKDRSDECVEDFLTRSCTRVMHKFELNDSTISLIHCNRAEIIGKNHIDSIINNFDDTMSVNYWTPEKPEFIFCGFPSLTLKNMNLFLHRFDEHRFKHCHSYNDIFAYNINHLIPYNTFISTITCSLCYRIALLFTKLILNEYETECKDLELDYRSDTNIPMLKNIICNYDIGCINWSYIDNNSIHNGRVLFEINSIKYRSHNRSSDISKIYKKIKSVNIISDELNEYIFLLSGNCKKLIENNILSVREYIVSHIVMDSLKDKTLLESLEIIKSNSFCMNDTRMDYYMKDYYILKNDIEAYNVMIEHKNNGHIVLNFPINGDRDMNYHSEDPSKLPLLNNIFSEEYIPIVKYRRIKGTVEAVFFEEEILKKYGNKYAKIKFIPSTINL
ncbi:hypothetical protein HDU92_008456 [Lobulomyces angularis]|nr:hypothetical protein HDU92_008456 [Lobulomyces angularis]